MITFSKTFGTKITTFGIIGRQHGFDVEYKTTDNAGKQIGKRNASLTWAQITEGAENAPGQMKEVFAAIKEAIDNARKSFWNNDKENYDIFYVEKTIYSENGRTKDVEYVEVYRLSDGKFLSGTRHKDNISLLTNRQFHEKSPTHLFVNEVMS